MKYGESTTLSNTNFVNSHQVKLQNGIKVLILRTPSPVVSLSLFFWGGLRLETPAQAGISHLLAALLTCGTTSRSAAEIAEYLESWGASLCMEAEADYFVLRLKALQEDLPTLLPLLAHFCRDSFFPEEEFQKAKETALFTLAEQHERPLQYAYHQLQPLLYGKHPYGLPTIGTVDSLQDLQADDLHKHMRQFWRPDWLTISIASSMPTERSVALVIESFGNWKVAGSISQPNLPDATFQPMTRHLNVSGQQVWLLLGYPAPAVHDRHYFACKLINAHLGNGSSSRLFVELRENQGLVYDTSSFFPTRLDRSQFMIYLNTSADYFAAAQQALYTECDRLCRELLSEQVLQLAKNKLIGNYALSKQTPAQVSHIMAYYTVLGLPATFDSCFTDRIQSLSATDLLNAAQHYLQKPAVAIVNAAI